jgi:hypothetical protein
MAARRESEQRRALLMMGSESREEIFPKSDPPRGGKRFAT